jgi:hypothetical protein
MRSRKTISNASVIWGRPPDRRESFFPPLKGEGKARQGGVAGVSGIAPTRRLAAADLPLSGGGNIKCSFARRRTPAMKRLAFALAVLTIVFAVSPARADYALVRFEDGWCRIWWDSAGTPWGVGLDQNCDRDARLADRLGRAEQRPRARRVPLEPRIARHLARSGRPDNKLREVIQPFLIEISGLLRRPLSSSQ